MPKNKQKTGITIEESWTIERYEVLQPLGTPRSDASASITVVHQVKENGVVIKQDRKSVSAAGLMPDGVTGKVQDMMINYIGPATQAALDAGATAAQAYDLGTVNGMYSWIQTNHPDVIPADAS